MATQSTFSYAQAAKGQGTTPSDNAASSASASVQDAEAPAANVETTTPAAEQATSTEAPETTSSKETAPVATEKQPTESAAPSESDNRSETTQERRSEPRRDEDTGRLDRPWRRNEKTPRSSSTTTRSADEQDARKSRRGKKGKSSEKQSGDQSAEKEQEAVPEPPKVELSEAPIPSVNIWHQRKEAHAAKGKPAAGNTVNGTSSQQEDKSTSKAESSAPAPHTNGVKPQQKATGAARPERSGPRGSRLADKDGKAGAPPSVEDSSSWPTPETVIQEDKKKTTVEKPSDRSDRSDKDSQEDGSSGKPRQTWVKYDYVPTVSFETQLPQMRGSKPRGGARSGRDSAARPAANGAPEKATTTPVSKSNESKSRETPSSTSSQPAAVKRAPAENANTQKKASSNSNADKAKDTTGQSNNDNTPTSRERPEGRNERGRGGYRGRGAHHVNAQAQHQHGAQSGGFNGQGAAGGRGQGHYSPPLRQGGHGNMFIPPNQRGRGGRNGAGNYHRMSAPNSNARMPAVQAQFTPYDYSMVPAMAYQPQQPYWDNVVLTMLRSQIEYYFSIENLCKDMFLRSRMDSQGFVPLHFIAAFKRMRDLSGDINLIRAVCEASVEVDFVVGEDDCERLRRRQDWQKFVLPMQDRDELARNDGPSHVKFKNTHYSYPNGQFNGVPPMPYLPHGYPMSPSDPSFQQYADIPQVGHGINGVANNGTSQLSAEVPDFAPTGTVPIPSVEAASGKAAQADAVNGLTNGHVETPLTNGVHAEEAQATQS